MVGVLAAVGLGRFVSGLLFEVRAHDPVLLTAMVVVIVLVTLAAALIPARRASRVNPVESLR